MPRSSWTPADPRRTHHSAVSIRRSLCLGFWHVDTIAICLGAAFATDVVTRLYQVFGECGLSCGLRHSRRNGVSDGTLQRSRSTAFRRLLVRCNTRYGWVVSPLPNRVFHPVRKRQASLDAPTLRISCGWQEPITQNNGTNSGACDTFTLAPESQPSASCGGWVGFAITF